MNNLSDKLKQLRGSTSQAEMARQLGMKQPQWARYESGVSSPSIEVLTNICRVHCVSADWLLGLGQVSSTDTKTAPPDNGIVIVGDSPACSKCPYKKKLKQLEKVFRTT